MADDHDHTGDEITADGYTGDDENLADTDNFDGAEEGPGGGTTPVRPAMMTGWQRLSQTFLHPPGPTTGRPKPGQQVQANLSDAERARRINQIDPTERKVGIAASVLAAVFALVYTIPYMVTKISVVTTVKPLQKACADGYKYTVTNGTATCNGVLPASHYAFPLVIWLVLAAAIMVTVKIGRRAPLAFAIVLTGLAFGTLILILPFVVAGGWLLLRAWRTQKYGAPTAKSPVEGYVRPAPGANRRAAAAGGPMRNSTRRQRRDPDLIEGVRQAPSQSKRYTPKAPPKKKIPPSN